MNRTLHAVQSLALTLLATAGLAAAAASTETVNLDLNLRNGGSAQVNVKGGTITRIEVEVKRLNAKQQDTYLTAQYSDGDPVDGGRKLQVDRQDLHELSWEEDGGHAEDRRITITAHNGDVHIRRVVVTGKAGGDDREVDVREKIRSGDTLDIQVEPGRIRSIQVRAKRVNAAETQTSLSATYSNGRMVDGGKKLQVDGITLRDISWEPDGEHRESRRITLQANEGDVYVEKVMILYSND